MFVMNISKPKSIKIGDRYAYECVRCGHSWLSNEPNGETLVCAGCKTAYWWMPTGTLSRGRRPKKAQ